MQTDKNKIKFPWVAFVVVIVIAAVWGYTHRGKEDLIVEMPKQNAATDATAPVAKTPAAREAARLPAVPKAGAPKISQGEAAEMDTMRVHPLDEPDPEKDLPREALSEREDQEARIRAAREVPAPR